MKKFLGSVLLSAVCVTLCLSSATAVHAAQDDDIVIHWFDGRAYAVIEKVMTWHEAKAYCERLDGGHLVTIT